MSTLLLMAMALSIAANTASADEVVSPPGGQWGDPNATANLLKLNHDPGAEPAGPQRQTEAKPGTIRMSKTCTDSQGRTVTEHDPNYESCLRLRNMAVTNDFARHADGVMRPFLPPGQSPSAPLAAPGGAHIGQ